MILSETPTKPKGICDLSSFPLTILKTPKSRRPRQSRKAFVTGGAQQEGTPSPSICRMPLLSYPPEPNDWNARQQKLNTIRVIWMHREKLKLKHNQQTLWQKLTFHSFLLSVVKMLKKNYRKIL